MFLPGKVTQAFKKGEDGAIKYEDGRVRMSSGEREQREE